MTAEDFISLPQYSLTSNEKANLLTEFLSSLHLHHLTASETYNKINEKIFHRPQNIQKIEDLPFVPVSAFKNLDLLSVEKEKIFKVLTSSGTSGTVPSKVYLDAETAKMQTLALTKIMGHVLGRERLPMLILDSKEVIKNRTSFSARGAGILGYSVFGKDHTYALDENYHVDYNTIDQFLEKHNGKPIFIFGFTFMIWQYFVQNISKERKLDLQNGILVHGGGWKKMIEQSVDNQEFKNVLNNLTGLNHIYNFYGMVEQVGSIFLENSQGFMHCPNFADVVIRNPKDLSPLPIGEEGLIQVLSILPKSYPGFSLLTEDMGVLMGEDNAENGWKGKYFKITGRAKKAELRGCSDTFSAQ